MHISWRQPSQRARSACRHLTHWKWFEFEYTRRAPREAQRARRALVVETQDDLGVVVEDLVDVLLRQSAFPDVVKRLTVRLVGKQHGVVAARHQVVGSEGLPRAEEGGL